MRLARLIRNLTQRGRLERDLDEELRSFVEMSADEARRAGASEDDARRAALLELGGVDQVKERVREIRAGARLEQLSRDLAYAVRTLRRSPGFAAVALASMALGIGGTTAIFSVMDALYWRPLPVRRPEQLVRIGLTDTLDSEGRRRVGSLTPFHFSSLNQRLDGVFTGVISAGSRDGVSLTVDGVTERIVPDAVSLDYFAVLGVPAFRGRTFGGTTWAGEVVLNHRFWRSRFGADPAVLGRTILLNGYPFTIVGVAPPGFLGTEVGAYSELWMPKLPPALEASFPALPLLQRGRWYGTTLARLRPGVSLDEARGAAEAAYQAAVREQYGESSPYRGTHVTLRSEQRGSSELRGGYERPLAVLAGLAALVLLIACANIASLLLGRATARRQEIAIRLAIGAGRARLVRQLLTESLLLAFLGGALGVLLAYRGADALLRFVPQTHLHTALDVRPDLRVLAFALGAAVLTGILAGLVPALQGTRVELTAALKGGGASGQRRLVRWRRGLVVGEVALSMVLTVGAVLFARTLHNLQSVDYGFDPDGLVLFTFKHVHERYSVDQVHMFCHDLLARVGALPGVRAAGLSDEGGPFNPRGSNPRTVSLPASPGGASVRAQLDRVSPGFFESLGLPLLAGRDFTPADRAAAPKVAVVNEPAARALFPGANPLGRRIVVGEGERAEEVEVVGVVPGVRHKSLRVAHEPSVYLPLFQAGKPHMPTLFVRADGGAAALVPAVRQEFQALDGELPVFNVKTMTRQVGETLARERLLATLSGLFAALAALLAAIGLHAVIAQAVVRRTREIGIRMALGARPGGVAWLVLREALGLVGVGVVLGLAAAWALARLLSTLLFGLTPADPASLLLAVALMLAVGALAGYAPARRAALLDPTRALRYE
jgi:predicted permease